MREKREKEFKEVRKLFLKLEEFATRLEKRENESENEKKRKLIFPSIYARLFIFHICFI